MSLSFSALYPNSSVARWCPICSADVKAFLRHVTSTFLHSQVTPQAYTGVIVEEVVKFSDQFCTPATFTAPVSHPANYTGAVMCSVHMRLVHCVQSLSMLCDTASALNSLHEVGVVRLGLICMLCAELVFRVDAQAPA